MSGLMQKTLDAMKQEQKADEQRLVQAEALVKDLEVKLREREHCIAVLEKAVGR